MAFIATEEYWDKLHMPHEVNADLYSPYVVPDKQILYDMSAWNKENFVGRFKFSDTGHMTISGGGRPVIHLRTSTWRFENEEDLALFRLRFSNEKCKIYAGPFRHPRGSSKK